MRREVSTLYHGRTYKNPLVKEALMLSLQDKQTQRSWLSWDEDCWMSLTHRGLVCLDRNIVEPDVM